MLQLLLKYLCTHVMQGEHGEAAGDLYSQTRHGGMPHAVPNPDDPNYSHFKEVLWWKFVTSWSADACMCMCSLVPDSSHIHVWAVMSHKQV